MILKYCLNNYKSTNLIWNLRKKPQYLCRISRLDFQGNRVRRVPNWNRGTWLTAALVRPKRPRVWMLQETALSSVKREALMPGYQVKESLPISGKTTEAEIRQVDVDRNTRGRGKRKRISWSSAAKTSKWWSSAVKTLRARTMNARPTRRGQMLPTCRYTASWEMGRGSEATRNSSTRSGCKACSRSGPPRLSSTPTNHTIQTY